MEISSCSAAPSVEELLAEIAASMTPTFDPETEITAGMLATQTGRSFGECKNHLDALVKQGVLICRQVVANGKHATAYKKPAG